MYERCGAPTQSITSASRLKYLNSPVAGTCGIRLSVQALIYVWWRETNPTDRLNFTRALLERLKQLPGVRAAAATTVLPLVGRPTLHELHRQKELAVGFHGRVDRDDV